MQTEWQIHRHVDWSTLTDNKGRYSWALVNQHRTYSALHARLAWTTCWSVHSVASRKETDGQFAPSCNMLDVTGPTALVIWLHNNPNASAVRSRRNFLMTLGEKLAEGQMTFEATESKSSVGTCKEGTDCCRIHTSTISWTPKSNSISDMNCVKAVMYLVGLQINRVNATINAIKD